MREEKDNRINQCPLCKKCEFYIKESDTCKVKKEEKCSEKDINTCTDFLISDKLINF